MAFQRARKLPAADPEAIRAALVADTADVLTKYTITREEADGPFAKSIPKDLMEQSKLDALHYTSIVEALAEKFHASPALLKQLNAGATFAAGDVITVPNVHVVHAPARGAEPGRGGERGRGAAPARDAGPPPARGTAAPPARGAAPPPPRETASQPAPAEAAKVVVSKGQSVATAYAANGDVIFHAPVTSGSERDPLPVGTWEVTAVTRNPTFNYNPDLFWDADPSHAKAKIPPGPNGPVGVVWIDLSKEHYGLHGTPEPSRIGYTSSHGCVRLTNWDAMRLANLVKKGTPVIFEP